MTFRDIGIQTMRTGGREKVLCPECSHTRTNKREKCLSLDHDDGLYNCHHCGWSGSIHERRQKRPNWVRPTVTFRDGPTQKVIYDYCAERGISRKTVDHFRIDAVNHYGIGPAMSFPFVKNGEIVNVKYRTRDKQFSAEPQAEITFFNRDVCLKHKEVYVVEGEFDALALYEIGIENVVSFPNGAGSNLDFLGTDPEVMENVERWILAGDKDEAGEKIQQEFIRRVGADRCLRVTWADDAKDANEMLIKHSAAGLRAALAEARMVPVEGAWEVDALRDDLKTIYKFGRPQGADPGWANLAGLYRVRAGDWTVVLGMPGAGKTTFMVALQMNLARNEGWVFAVYPPENLPPEEYLSLLVECYTGVPFSPQCLSEAELDEALNFLHEHFIILNPGEGQRNLEGILRIAKSLALRRGITGLIIDPWNELEQSAPTGMTETMYVTGELIKFRHFCRLHKIHGWIVVHPTKLPKTKDGKYNVPTLYDANGSAAWNNKCDVGMVLHRDMGSPVLGVHIQKVRKKWCGTTGSAYLMLDRQTGRYEEVADEQGRYTDRDRYVPEEKPYWRDN